LTFYLFILVASFTTGCTNESLGLGLYGRKIGVK